MFHLVGKCYIVWMAAFDPASWPTHAWSDPAAFFTSFFTMYITNFLAVQCRTSLTPIGCTPGFLFNGINGLAVKASKLFEVSKFERCMFVLHKRFTKFSMDVRESNWLEAKILRQLSASSPDGPLLLLLSLLNFYRCIHKECCVFVFLGPFNLTSLRGELVELLDVSDSQFVRFRWKVVVFHCSYSWLISAVHHLHYFFASAAWIF